MSQTTLIRALENFLYFGLTGLVSVIPTLGIKDSWIAGIMAVIGFGIGALKSAGIAPTSTSTTVSPTVPTPMTPSL